MQGQPNLRQGVYTAGHVQLILQRYDAYVLDTFSLIVVCSLLDFKCVYTNFPDRGL